MRGSTEPRTLNAMQCHQILESPVSGMGQHELHVGLWVVQPTKISSLHPESSLEGFDTEIPERFEELLDDDESDSEEESDWSSCISLSCHEPMEIS